ncbi:ABC transporter ATP-binding protein [Pseudoduganella armeniaca]|uniref:ABC transporter ATP-binding protein n=1 Tax=Pseudoduganella armeniaca TaxID=2072590 RepID=A0A2R4CC88_9BURK|nr:ABC transporter ATP-binding protein [Pseudoduganella armeniaca]AVR97261.1 ABC transporter ATP-binding protein [Pseudoduganella armeniaca]
MNPVVVEARGLQKTFGRQHVLRGVDWRLPRGTVVGLLGRNGAGKSTLIECLLGLRETDAGSVSLFGEPVTALSEGARGRIGYVPQKAEAFEWLTPVQMLEYFRALYPRWNDARVEGLLRRWGFGGELRDKPIGRLSGGEKQRLAIIRALAHEPELLVLDEPVASLDPVGRREFLRELIGTVADGETTVVFSTHILSDLERVALDVAFLHDGRIGLQAPLDELLEGARRITGPAAALDALGLGGELRRERHPGGSVTVVARLSDAEQARLRALDGVQADALSLEDLFVEVTK